MSLVESSGAQSPLIMGILNVTPDSFSDGGVLFSGGRVSIDAAMRQAEQMVADGASYIDVGGESTRPGAQHVSEQEELERVIPVVERICASIDVDVSVDTSTPQVMREAARAGAAMINDVRALRREGALDAAQQTGLAVCLMHMQGEPSSMQQAPSYHDVVQQVREFFVQRVDEALAAGIAAEKIYLDPGFGFGKTLEHNLQLFARLDQLSVRGIPLLVGFSRKSMIAGVLDVAADQRLYGGLALATIAAQQGVRCIRTHDVLATSQAVRMAQAVMVYQ